jgi:hypothetical protein
MSEGALKQAIAQKDLEIIDGSNVAQYMWSGVKPGWDLIGDVPNIAPPFPRMWIECRAPNIGKTPDGKTFSIDRTHIPGTWGLYIQAELIADIQAREVSSTEGQYVPAADAEGAKWLLFCVLYAEAEHQRPDGPLHAWWLPVGADGRIIMKRAEDGSTRPYFKTSMLNPDATNEEISAAEFFWLLPFITCMMTISFMHCKNVKQLVQTPPPKAMREAKKAYGRELVAYKVLQIEPMKRVLLHEGAAGTKGIQHALSVCRGHFKTFEQKGLFGKYTGTFWWADHARGLAEKGTVVHDYEVHPPREEATVAKEAAPFSGQDY